MHKTLRFMSSSVLCHIERRVLVTRDLQRTVVQMQALCSSNSCALRTIAVQMSNPLCNHKYKNASSYWATHVLGTCCLFLLKSAVCSIFLDLCIILWVPEIPGHLQITSDAGRENVQRSHHCRQSKVCQLLLFTHSTVRITGGCLHTRRTFWHFVMKPGSHNVSRMLKSM